MREFLDEAQQHIRDGLSRAQEKAGDARPKRFYTQVSVVEAGDVFEIRLDGRALKTPSKKNVAVPFKSLAIKVADEWCAQEHYIERVSMPVTRLTNAIIQGGDDNRAAIVDQIIEYAGNDLLFYRSDGPKELMAQQEKHWNPVIALLQNRFEIKFKTTRCVLPITQSSVVLEPLKNHLITWPLYAQYGAHVMTTLTGSALLAIARGLDVKSADDVWAAAHVDEDYNWAQWGADAEALERRAQRRKEFDAACLIVDLAFGRG